MWDETLLAYADRWRVLPEPCRKRVIVKAGDVLPAFTVDGFMASLWWPESDGHDLPSISFEHFAPISATDRQAFETEGQRLASFIATREPGVYSRYRRSRRRS